MIELGDPVGFSVFTENQIHDRVPAEEESDVWLTRILPFAAPVSQLAMVDAYGDTMFNIRQMKRILEELEGISRNHPEVAEPAASLMETIQRTIKRRGYLWISGD
jgi:hypothetical protein